MAADGWTMRESKHPISIDGRRREAGVLEGLGAVIFGSAGLLGILALPGGALERGGPFRRAGEAQRPANAKLDELAARRGKRPPDNPGCPWAAIATPATQDRLPLNAQGQVADLGQAAFYRTWSICTVQ